MTPYPKTKNVFNRDPATNYKTLINGSFQMEEVEAIKNCEWRGYEKLDGTNIRIIWDGAEIKVRGRSDRALIHPGLINAIEIQLSGDPFAGMTPLTMYGEGLSPKVQSGGGYGFTGVVIFAILNNSNGSYWQRESMEGFCSARGFPVAPLVACGTVGELVEIAANGFESLLPTSKPGHMAEGLIIQPPRELLTAEGDRVIAKIKTKDFK